MGEGGNPLKKYILQVITHVGENSFNAFVGHGIENKSWLRKAQLHTEGHKSTCLLGLLSSLAAWMQMNFPRRSFKLSSDKVGKGAGEKSIELT